MPEFIGVIFSIGETEHPSEKFSVRDFILDTSTEHQGKPIIEYIGCQVTNKNCEALDKFNVGDEIKIQASVGNYQILKDKSGKDKVFNNVTPWKIELIKSAVKAEESTKAGEKAPW